MEKTIKEETSTNSELGSYHWFHTIISKVSHIGEFLKEKTPDEEILRSWAVTLYDSAKELQKGYSVFSAYEEEAKEQYRKRNLYIAKNVDLESELSLLRQENERVKEDFEHNLKEGLYKGERIIELEREVEELKRECKSQRFEIADLEIEVREFAEWMPKQGLIFNESDNKWYSLASSSLNGPKTTEELHQIFKEGK